MTITDINEFMQSLEKKLQRGNPLEGNATIQLCLSGEGSGDWLMYIQGQQSKIQPGIADNPDAVLETSVEDFEKLLTNSEEEIGWAFMQGRINMTGNIMPLWRALTFLRGVHSES